jgi:hypothetical protein
LTAALPHPKHSADFASLEIALESFDKKGGSVTVTFNLKNSSGQVASVGSVTESRSAFKIPRKSNRVSTLDLVQNQFYFNDSVTILVNLK